MHQRILLGTAAAGLLLAVVLAAARVGEQPGALSDWQALVLGITQGLTELLPISSSAHLILVPWLGDWHYLEAHPGFNKTFDVGLHLGTLVAVVHTSGRTSCVSWWRGWGRCGGAGSQRSTSGSPGTSQSRPSRRRS